MTSGDRGLQSGRLSRRAPGAVAQPGYDTCVAARITVLDPAEVPDFVMLSDISRPAGMEPLAGVGSGDRVAVFGAGPVGLMAAHSAMMPLRGQPVRKGRNGWLPGQCKFRYRWRAA